jgi:hypothetical protein
VKNFIHKNIALANLSDKLAFMRHLSKSRDRISVRLKGLRKRLTRASARSGLGESDLLRAALREFFERNRTLREQMAASMRLRSAERENSRTRSPGKS